MRHRVNNLFKFNHKDWDHRNATIRNLCTSFFMHKSMITTPKRAKALSIMVDHLVNIVNSKDEMNAIREVQKNVFTKESSIELFKNIAPKYKDRKCGLTTTTPIKYREWDGAKLVKIQLV